MAKPDFITLADDTTIPIVYEDRSVLAIDKPAGWLLAPSSWENTSRNLQLAVESSLQAGDFWARSRNLRFLRFIHRLDADTSGVLLLVKSPGAVGAYTRLFESRAVEKRYLTVVNGVPTSTVWSCDLSIQPDPRRKDCVRAVPPSKASSTSKTAQTQFTVLKAGAESALVLVRPLTGRTHQIRVHLAAAGYPVLNDPLYGSPSRAEPAAEPGSRRPPPLSLRAISLAYQDPFTQRAVRIHAPFAPFAKAHGFSLSRDELFAGLDRLTS